MKLWYRSKTIIGSILGLISGLMGLVGVEIGQEHVDRATDLITGECGQSVVSVVTIFSSVLTFWGRHTAKTALRWRRRKPEEEVG